MDSFVMKWWVGVFKVLDWLSPFHLVQKALPRATKTHGFVDRWVVGHGVAGVCAWLFITMPSPRLVAWLVLGYGALRVLEISTYNLGVLFVHPLTGHEYTFRSFRRSVVLAMLNCGEVLFWFAAAYRYVAGHFGDNAAIISSLDGSLYYSVVTMTTVGYGDIAPQDALTRWLAIAHMCVTVLLTLIVLVSFVSLLPKPKSLDPNEKT